MVLETNQYWDADDLTADIATTNRSLAQGEGIVMAQALARMWSVWAGRS
jgi:hypothetical protein